MAILQEEAQCFINDRQFSSGFFFLVLIYGNIKGIITCRKCGGDKIDVNRLAVTYLLHVSLLKLWTCKGIWERKVWICIRALDFFTATIELIISTFLLLYQNLDKDSSSLSGFHAHGIQSTPIQFESSKFWLACYNLELPSLQLSFWHFVYPVHSVTLSIQKNLVLWDFSF